MKLKKVTSLFTCHYINTLSEKVSSKVIDKETNMIWYNVKNGTLVGKDGIKDKRYFL